MRQPRATKGEETRGLILRRALSRATQVGLTGLSIGALARDIGMSKSGLFAHFGSKEGLQRAVLEVGASRFVDEIVMPSIALPRGEPRVRALYENWMDWTQTSNREGGCIFVSCASELDDRPGPVRDCFAELIGDWLRTLERAARLAIEVGHFRPADPAQFAMEQHGILLAFNVQSRLFRNPSARAMADIAFERLLDSARNPH